MKTNYTGPVFKKQAFTCPHCGTFSVMDYNCVDFNGSDTYLDSGYNFEDNIITATCQHCHKHIIWVKGEYVYPDIMIEDPNPDMPESVRELYMEAGSIYRKSPRAACALLRLALDQLCTELGETDPDINLKMAALAKKGLKKEVIEALLSINAIGDNRLDPGKISCEENNDDEVHLLMTILNIITDQMITSPKSIKELSEKLTK